MLLVLVVGAVATMASLLSGGPGGPGGPGGTGGAAGPATPLRPATVVVQPGQTLWQVAAEVAPTTERRAAVDALMRANSLASAGSLVSGQQLVVPRDL